jgi:cation diffusion facilitator family transporter
VLLVVLLATVTMVAEIAVGYATGSMALLADGWHMATHVGALGLSSTAYVVARRYASHRAFVFGTGKVHALAGYTSAMVLGLVAVVMMVESTSRLLHHHTIDFEASLPIAVLGFVVNLASVFLLHDHEDDHHEPGHHTDAHDHNHSAALMHVVADTLTSALAIGALLAGRFFGWLWLDAVSGIAGGLVILKWSVSLSRNAATELLDLAPTPEVEEKIRAALEAMDDVRVSELRVWSLGRGSTSCILTLVSSCPREPHEYRERLAAFHLAQLTIEVQRCGQGNSRSQLDRATS